MSARRGRKRINTLAARQERRVDLIEQARPPASLTTLKERMNFSLNVRKNATRQIAKIIRSQENVFKQIQIIMREHKDAKSIPKGVYVLGRNALESDLRITRLARVQVFADIFTELAEIQRKEEREPTPEEQRRLWRKHHRQLTQLEKKEEALRRVVEKERLLRDHIDGIVIRMMNY